MHDVIRVQLNRYKGEQGGYLNYIERQMNVPDGQHHGQRQLSMLKLHPSDP